MINQELVNKVNKVILSCTTLDQLKVADAYYVLAWDRIVDEAAGDPQLTVTLCQLEASLGYMDGKLTQMEEGRQL